MPVTVRPSAKTAESWGKGDLSPELDVRFTHATSAEQLLASTTSKDGPPTRQSLYDYPFEDELGRGRRRGGAGGRGPLTATGRGGDAIAQNGDFSRNSSNSQRGIPELIQTSFTSLDRSSSTTFATKNGFVHACIEAYNEHHNLVLRPEDIWFAILTQLSSYINAHADHLKPQLLHSPNATGQKQKQALHIETNLSAPDFSHGEMALQMTELISSNLAEPSLREWILPAFSTTNSTDQAVASIIFMGTLQKYFTYSWGTRCGIPSVTLLGELDDWIEIAQRCASHLATGKFGEGPMRWYSRILRPILGGFIESYRDPGGRDAKRFWKGIVDRYVPDGSGKVAYSGWITGFCYWDENGECLHKGKGVVELERGEVPVGFVKVPVTLWDDGVRIETEMVAGSVAIEILKGDDLALENGSGRSTPGSGSEIGGDGMILSSSPTQIFTAGTGTSMSQAAAAARGGGSRGSWGSSTSSRGSDRGGHRWEGYNTIQPQSGWFMYRV